MLRAFSSFGELWSINAVNSKRTFAMAKVSLNKRYSGSLLGIFWGIVKPTLFIAVYWFAIAIGIRGGKPMEDVPYILWLIPGIVPWFFLADSLTIGGSSVRSNSHLVTKMVYPVATLPVSEVLSLFFVHLMMLALATAVFVFSGFGLTIYFVQILYYVFCALAFAIVTATLLSALTAVSRDIEHMVKSTITMLFWLSPILWSLDRIGTPLRHIIMLNPIAYIALGYRNAFVTERWFFAQWEYMTYFWCFMLVLTLFSSFMFSTLQKEFADVL